VATRLYFESPASGIVPTPSVTPSGWHSSWNKTKSDVSFLSPSKHTAGAQGLPFNALSGTAGHFTGFTQVVSIPLTAQTISGTVKGQILSAAASSATDATVAIAIRVLKSDGTERGVLLAPTASDDTSTTPPEVSTTRTNRRFLDSTESASLTLTSVDASDGDVLVVELGQRQTSSSVLSNDVALGPTGASFTDVPEDDTTTTGIGWLEFSGTVQFKTPYLFGSSSTPADGAAATGTADPTAVTPPTGMLAGDLVFLIADARIASLTQAISNAGGQTWTSHTQQSATTKSVRVFTCTFNGTWSANPSVSFGSATCNSAYMHVFRPPSTSYTWSVNVAQTSTNDTTSPFSALAGHTTTGTNPTVTLQGWHSPDDNTWGTLTGTGWEVTGTAQYRNTSGSDQSASFAHIISTTAQTLATAGKSQLTLGADNTQIWEITMAAAAPVTGGAVSSIGAATAIATGKSNASSAANSNAVATATGVGKALVSGAMSSAGGATATMVGVAAISGAASSAGSATATAAGQSRASGDANAVAGATATAAGAATSKSDITSAGTATGIATGQSNSSSDITAAGSATAIMVGDAAVAGSGAAVESAGSATAIATSSALAKSDANAVASATVIGAGKSQASGAISSTGSATATMVGKAAISAAASSAGAATAIANGQARASSAISSAGSATAIGTGQAQASGDLNAAGSATGIMEGTTAATGAGAMSAAASSTAIMGGAALAKTDVSANGTAIATMVGDAQGGGVTPVEESTTKPSQAAFGYMVSRKERRRQIEEQDRQDIADLMQWLDSEQWREAA
jgi:hypothetical protein